MSGGSRPAFGTGAGGAPATDPRRNAPRGLPAPSSNTLTAITPLKPAVPLSAVPGSSDLFSSTSDDGSLASEDEGDNGDRKSDADYNPADDQGTGTADDNDEDEDEDEEDDDLNYSQESAADLTHSTHSSPVKSPGLGSPAAAARSRAEETPQRALFGQTSASAVQSAPVKTVGQSGATSSLMGFMKTSSKFPAAAQQPAPSAQASHSQYAHSSGSSAHGSDSESVSSDGSDVS